MSHALSRFATMSDEQYWDLRLDEFLEFVGDTAKTPDPANIIHTLRNVVGRWIEHALKRQALPGERNDALLDEWVTSVLAIEARPQGDYRARVRRWWNWMEARQEPAESAFADQDPQVKLARLVAEFRRAGYSRDIESEQMRARERLEAILYRLPEIPYADRQQVNELWRKQPGHDYGGPGNIVLLKSLIDRASEAGWAAIQSRLSTLCFGTADVAERLQSAVGEIDGVGWTTATRLVAIGDPQRFIPNYSLYNKGRWAGKLDNLRMLVDDGLLEKEAQRSAEEVLRDHPRSKPSGRAVVESNDLLLEILRPYFTDGDVVDTWGMRTFLYWLSERYAGHDEPAAMTAADENAEAWVDEADLADLADDVLCDVIFLRDIVRLLEDKGQVILYGPPGTGKTYFAQRLAVMLSLYEDSDDDGAFSLVQFHPAYSYEDFFEGYRPAADDDGNMTYRLTPGPLVRLAERAAEHPDELHVMVIDEINRANLPRVLGELLYLLEYRDEWTQTQYRPVDGFVLPSNLWFIGTMNTADRSIALIDAAMRRRFHFVPFFPNRPPTEGLLRRWTQRNAPEQVWVAELLDRVNGELEQVLGGDHLLIGPSHFMKPGLDKDSLRRIWNYNIEPLIEDQLFGHQDAIDSFRFDAVWKRHGPGAAAQEEPAEPSETLVDDDVGDTESGEDESGGSASE